MTKEDEMLKELQKIRELLASKPAPPPPPPKGLWNEFKNFLEQYKVMGLAVAFIMGVYLGASSIARQRFAVTSNRSRTTRTHRLSQLPIPSR
jgi:hypothetical protein